MPKACIVELLKLPAIPNWLTVFGCGPPPPPPKLDLAALLAAGDHDTLAALAADPRYTRDDFLALARAGGHWETAKRLPKAKIAALLRKAAEERSEHLAISATSKWT